MTSDMKRFFLALLFLALFGAAAELNCINTSQGALLFDGEYASVSFGEYEKAYPLADFGMYKAKTAEGWTVLDGQGVRIGDTYQKIGACEAGIIVMKDQKYQLLGADLVPVNKKQYMLITPLSSGALALKGQSWDSIPDRVYYLDRDGQEYMRDIRLIFTGEEQEGLLPACDGETGLWGYIGEDAVWAIAPSFASASGFVNGIAPASALSGMGVINRNGEWLLHPLFTDVRLNERLILCRELGALYVYRRDENGLILISAFERAEGELTGEYYIVRAEGETEIYDSYGTLMMNCEGEGLIYPGLPSQLVFRVEEGYRAVDIETMEASKTYGVIRANEEYGAYLCGDLNEGAMRYGLMDESFREILPVVYDSVSVNKDGIAAALKADGLEVYALAGDHAPVLLTTINKTDTEE